MSLFGCGDNSSGELGLGHCQPIVGKLTRLKLQMHAEDPEPNVTASSCGSGFSVIHDSSTLQTFSCGEAFGGHLGVGCGQCFPIKEFVPIPRLQGLKVTMIASGMYHTACLIEGGSVFAWGRNNDGQCGMLPSEQPICYEPTEVILLRWTVVTKVACGCCHSLAITEDGKLYSWGWDNYGKIIQNQDVNIHAESPRLTEDVITIFAGLPAESQRTISNPTEVLLRNGNCYEYVVDVSAGFGFTTCITVEGGVFSWGFNDHGQLGNGSNTPQFYPIQVFLNERDPATKISCGFQHACVVTNDGRLYSWGQGGIGQLGRSSRVDCKVPTKVEYFLSYKCRSVACGFDYTFVVAQHLLSGLEKVVAFGGNSSGQLGLAHRGGVCRSDTKASSRSDTHTRICPSAGTVAAVWATPTWFLDSSLSLRIVDSVTRMF